MRRSVARRVLVASQGSDPRGTGGSPRGGDRMPEEHVRDGVARSGERRPSDEPDVILDVPVLNVEELDLEADDLRTHVSVRAEVADLVKINVGIDAYLDTVKLGIKGVEAQAMLKVRLERILATLERAMDVIDRDPGILRRTADELGAAGPDSERLEIEEERIEEESGRIVGLARDEAGNVVEKPLDEEGNIVGDAAEGEDATTAAREKARALGVELGGLRGTGSGGRILVRDVERAARDSVEATPAAREKARALGVDLLEVTGSGSGGRITVRDVVRASGEG